MQAMKNSLDHWINGLSKTRKSSFGKIRTFLGATEINPDTWHNLEEMFIQSDLGVNISTDLIDHLKSRGASEGITGQNQLIQILEEELLQRLTAPPQPEWNEKPTIILITGVNGSGKTTTIAKLGSYFQQQGKLPLFIAADTFRAGAAEQLRIWGERLKIPVISGQKNSDPGAVVFDGINSAVSRNIDLVFIDTAGRLHTSYNLMEELKKVHRVAGKALAGAPHASWLVMDATTGQNGLHQAESFLKAIPLDGVILAKLDSSAKGGMVFSIQEKLNLPVIYAGLGESSEDLVPFQNELFVQGILNQE
jgi:fused signal recognition particle receptor